MAAVLAFWLLVTVAVAFLREAKAVRDSRELLAQDKAQEAWGLLEPFLQKHPRHRQALFLCGKATVRIGNRTQAKQCLTVLNERSKRLEKELSEDYLQVLTQQTRTQGCDATGFEEVFSWAEGLGEPYAGSVVAGLDAVVAKCHEDGNPYLLAQFAAVLAEKGQAFKLIEQGYVPAISRALAKSDYDDARSLAQYAVRLVPEGAAAVKAALDRERGKVAVTVGTLRRLCEGVKSDPHHRSGSTWCFPAAAPGALREAKDGWGRPVVYNPLRLDEGQRCHRGFALTSFGGDGKVTENDWQTPSAEIVCRFLVGQESWQLPNRYWLAAENR